METPKTNQEKCCASVSRKKKIIGAVAFIFAILIVLSIAVAAGKAKLHQESQVTYALPQDPQAQFIMHSIPGNVADQFVLPQDAAKTGEIMMQVANADEVSKNISAVASSNGGTVYATYVSYSQNDGAKNGFMVVQVDAGQFDQTYAALKTLGTKIIQESSSQIYVPNYPYAVPMSAVGTATPDNAPAPKAKGQTATATATSAQAPNIAFPIPVNQPNKGYIKVNFVEAATMPANIANTNRGAGAAVYGAGYEGMGLRRNIWFVMAIKSIMVIILIAIIIILVIRLVRHMRLRRQDKKKPAVHIVRQAVKTRSRVVKIARKK